MARFHPTTQIDVDTASYIDVPVYTPHDSNRLVCLDKRLYVDPRGPYVQALGGEAGTAVLLTDACAKIGLKSSELASTVAFALTQVTGHSLSKHEECGYQGLIGHEDNPLGLEHYTRAAQAAFFASAHHQMMNCLGHVETAFVAFTNERIPFAHQGWRFDKDTKQPEGIAYLYGVSGDPLGEIVSMTLALVGERYSLGDNMKRELLASTLELIVGHTNFALSKLAPHKQILELKRASQSKSSKVENQQLGMIGGNQDGFLFTLKTMFPKHEQALLSTAMQFDLGATKHQHEAERSLDNHLSRSNIQR